MLLLNTGGKNSFEYGIGLLGKYHSVDIACSYLQPRGWDIVRKAIPRGVLSRSKLVFTDQLAITNPAAVLMALDDGVDVRRYKGDVTFHPKCFIGLDDGGKPEIFLLGSANISASALRSGVEAGLMGQDAKLLSGLHSWFNDLHNRQSTPIGAVDIESMQSAWEKAAAARAKSRLKVVVAVGKRAILAAPPAELIETYEDAFDSIGNPIGMLDFDHARNNIRNLAWARVVLAKWPAVHSKAISEMKLLGMADGKTLTKLGKAAAAAKDIDELAFIWCSWLLDTSDDKLAAISPRVLAAKRALTRFCNLDDEVSSFFMANAREKSERKVLQTIEILCSASGMVERLGMKEVRVLSNLLPDSQHMNPDVAAIIREYFENKGPRGWDKTDDRRVMIRAFRRASAARA